MGNEKLELVKTMKHRPVRQDWLGTFGHTISSSVVGTWTAWENDMLGGVVNVRPQLVSLVGL